MFGKLEECCLIGLCLDMYIVSFSRCYYIAATYVIAKKWAEALGLYERVLQYITDALNSYAALGHNKFQKVGLHASLLSDFKRGIIIHVPAYPPNPGLLVGNELHGAGVSASHS